MHVVFPSPAADPGKSESYDFAATDDFLRAIDATGAKVIYRLGESIEHTPTKYHVHPPADPQRWAAACVGIVRHYKDSVEYWEIWNEPENRPAMWTGSDEQYLELYEVASKAIKAEFPLVKVGGPALGYSGKIVEGKFEPSAFLLKFLARCKNRSLPLDFFSWHLYSDDPGECVIRARGLRELLNRSGFNKTEVHLNEWNYLPGNDWRPVTKAGQGELRRRFNEQLAGAAAAAFVASTLINLQDSPVDQANIFRADNGGFGLFAPDGNPNKPFYAFKAFRMLLDDPVRVEAKGDQNILVCAGMNQAKNQLTILLTNYNFS
jgi:beta-xylosidase